jgi:CxxC-x17-CxxC domain-containing protein
MIFVRDFNNRDRRPSGGRDFKRRDFDRGPQVMHQAVCSNCNKDCEVPFKPNGSKPVLCRDCFQASRNSGQSDYRPRPSFQDRGEQQDARPVQQPQYDQQFQSLNQKLDKILNLLTPKEVKEAVSVQAVKEPEVVEVAKASVIKKKRVVKITPEEIA